MDITKNQYIKILESNGDLVNYIGEFHGGVMGPMTHSYEADGSHLVWHDDIGLGYYPVNDFVYGKDYFDKYKGYESNDVNDKLMSAREHFVKTGLDEQDRNSLVDIGIGSGAFMKHMDCDGYDVNPTAITLLKSMGKWKSPYDQRVSNATFWDSLEHIHEPSALLENITDRVFVSCPIYDSFEHVIESKHFRTDEHFWYWTVDGFDQFMQYCGFSVLHMDNFEEGCGREDIKSFICEKTRERNK